MKIKIRAIASMFVATAAFAASAQADTIAGWDFSQYYSDGLLTIDGSTFTTSLDANYSSLDPTFNAGAESAAFGTLSISGSVVPTAGSLESNLDGPADAAGENSFDSRTILEFEGQLFQELMSLTAVGSADLVFVADLTSVNDTAELWSVSFGGKTFSDSSCAPNCSSTVSVEFSTNGSSYTSFGSVLLDANDQAFSVALAPTAAATGYVRLGLESASGQPIIDNVAIKATPLPEPTASVGFLAGAVCLAAFKRLRG
jgi:hypothetical protein